jgi:hypothetical protein
MTMKPTPGLGPNDLRRDRAVRVDEANGIPSGLATLWKGLTNGNAKVEDAFTRARALTFSSVGFRLPRCVRLPSRA